MLITYNNNYIIIIKYIMTENYKKILCYNILNKKICSYGDKCLFAHNLKEQIINENKKKIMNMILNDNNLSYFNICLDDDFYKELLVFTIRCNKCYENNCNGGYNCKNGVCCDSLLICWDDLITGKCKNKVINKYCCNGIHLTEKNLIPYNIQLYMYPNLNFVINNNIQDSSYLLNNKYKLNDESIIDIDEVIENHKVINLNKW
jgi:hypothetical protein